MRFFDDYDIFNAGETWYTEKSESLYVTIGDDDSVLMKFDSDSEVKILDIDKSSGYGFASVEVEGYRTVLSLDELYDMVFED